VVTGQGGFFQRGRGGAGPRGPPRGGFSTIRGGGPGAFNSGAGFREPSLGGGFSSGGGFGGSSGGSAGGRGVGGSNNIIPALKEPTSDTSSMDGGFGGGSSQGQNGNGNGGTGAGMAVGSEGRPQTVRNIYVYSAPDEPSDAQTRTIRVPGGQDKQVNIIFLKTPSQSSAQQTEVILPKQAQQQTIVYVLVKKGESDSKVMIRKPPTPAPSKPQVFFIRYKNPNSSVTGEGSGSSSGSVSAGNSSGFGGGSSGSSTGTFGSGASDGGFGSLSRPTSFGTF